MFKVGQICGQFDSIQIGMQTITIKNFKSYQKQVLNQLNPNINIVLGSNGQGKSNLFKALSFALSDKLSLNRTEFNNCAHRGMDAAQDQDIEVEVILKERQNVNRQPVKVAKVWKQDMSEELYINEKACKNKEYETYIESLRISYSNPYNIIQQGRISQIVLMDEFELYKLLEEVTGARKFHKRKEEAIQTMKKVSGEKEEIRIILSDLTDKLRSLENRKEEFDFFAVEEKTKKYRVRRQLVEVLEATRKNILQLGEQYNDISDRLAKLTMKKKQIQERSDENKIYLKHAREKVASLTYEEAKISQTQMETQEINSLKKQLKAIVKKIREDSKTMQKKDKEISEFKKSFMEVERKYEDMKLGDEHRNAKDKNKFFEALEKELAYDREQLRQLTSEKKDIGRRTEEVEATLTSSKNVDIEKTHAQNLDLKSRLVAQLQANRKEQSIAAWNKNMNGTELDSMREVQAQNLIKLKKVLPLLDFNLLKEVRKARIRGVYGYFIEFVEINEHLAFAYEIAGINKLCSLLVEDENACIEVIELNKKIKGRQINIIQLDYLRRQPVEQKSFPKSNDVSKLINPKWIKPVVSKESGAPDSLLADVDRLISNTFGRHALVKDYATGLQIAKEYHLNCITSQKQIIYADGFLCKLGREQAYTETKLDAYARYHSKRSKLMEYAHQKNQIQEQLSKLQNDEIGLLNKMKNLDLALASKQPTINSLQSTKKIGLELKKSMSEINDRIQKLNFSILGKEKSISEMKKSKNVRQHDPNLEAEYLRKRKELNSMVSQVFELEENLQHLSNQQAKLQLQIDENEKIVQTKFTNQSGNMAQQIRRREGSLEEAERDINEIDKAESELVGEKGYLEIKLATQQAEEKDVLEEIEAIGQIEEDIEELEQMSNSMSLSHLSAKKKHHHYSAKDKLLFSKFSAMLNSFEENKKTYAELEEAEKGILELIDDYEKQVDEDMQKVSQKFEGAFEDIFKAIVGKGYAEVRFKRIAEKVREVMKYRSCLMIRVGFGDEPESMKKWNDFSGGEKTIIAISIIMALQRCQPAPFYILDEIDAALDPGYVQKLARLLAEQSEANKTQYLITSFREDMLQFPSSICNYYVVKNENRVSAIERVNQNQAVDALKMIVRDR